MAKLTTDYQVIAERDEKIQKIAKRHLDAINAKRSMDNPSGCHAPKFDGRGTREVEESRRMDNKRSKHWKGEK